MKILVCSCDKDVDLFLPFHHCMEKYWPNHPEIIYSTETLLNPYYKTINLNYGLNMWTKRIRETLMQLDDSEILIMMDDLFICNKIDEDRLLSLSGLLKNTNIACLNFEKQFDNLDIDTNIDGFKCRRHGSNYEVSIMCGLWDKDKLIKVLENDSDPWTVEKNKDNKGFDFYINSGDYIIDWGYRTFKPTGCYRGKWMRRTTEFLIKEGIKIDFSKRGIFD